MTPEPYHAEEEYIGVSFRELVASVRRQGSFILLTILGVVFAGAIGLTATYLLTPAEEVTSVPFRLEFQGAENRRYPSGVAFTTMDLVAGPVLRSVYQRNELERFVEFDDFSAAVYVVEENEELRRLDDEYRARLADSKLTAVDRERLEKEFKTKRESVARNSYALNHVHGVAGIHIPSELVSKVLGDVLEVWARYASEEKGVTRYQFPVLSENVVPELSEEPIVAIDALRSRIWDLQRNIDALRKIPGADSLRTKDGLTLAELEIVLDDVIRLHIRPLMSEFLAGRYAVEREAAIRFITSQLDHVKGRRADAVARTEALRSALALYAEASRPIPQSSSKGGVVGETIMPQIGDSFLDRIVNIVELSEDRLYRQTLVDKIAQESLAVVPYDTEIKYYEQLLDGLRSAPRPAVRSEGEPSVRTIEQARARVVSAVRHANEIYVLASENLNASRALYTITGPAQSGVARSISARRLLVIGLLILLAALPAAVVAAVIKDRMVDESKSEEERA